MPTLAEEHAASLQKLRDRGYKDTPQRRAVLRALSTLPSAAVGEIRKVCSGVGLVTVYRTLSLLQELGLAHRFYLDGRSRYALSTGGETTGRFICECCKEALELDGGQEATDSLLREIGVAASAATTTRVEVYGRCAASAARPATGEEEATPTPLGGA